MEGKVDLQKTHETIGKPDEVCSEEETNASKMNPKEERVKDFGLNGGTKGSREVRFNVSKSLEGKKGKEGKLREASREKRVDSGVGEKGAKKRDSSIEHMGIYKRIGAGRRPQRRQTPEPV